MNNVERFRFLEENEYFDGREEDKAFENSICYNFTDENHSYVMLVPKNKEGTLFIDSPVYFYENPGWLKKLFFQTEKAIKERDLLRKEMFL